MYPPPPHVTCILLFLVVLSHLFEEIRKKALLYARMLRLIPTLNPKPKYGTW